MVLAEALTRNLKAQMVSKAGLHWHDPNQGPKIQSFIILCEPHVLQGAALLFGDGNIVVNTHIATLFKLPNGFCYGIMMTRKATRLVAS